MSFSLELREFESIAALINSLTGLYYSIDRKNDLEKGLYAAALELNYTNKHELIKRLLTGQITDEIKQSLVRGLTIGETYLFREAGVLTLLIDSLKPIIEQRRAENKMLRIWSAGCCTGEEAYSLAIMLNRAIPDIDKWNLSILGTDINQTFLDKARAGTYRGWSFRGIANEYKNSYFTQIAEDNYQVIPRIKNHVRFEYLNLFESNYPSPITGTNNIDIILCRNVLMYFNEAGRLTILNKFHKCLTQTGFLALSLTELGYIDKNLFDTIVQENLFVFSKRSMYQSYTPKQTWMNANADLDTIVLLSTKDQYARAEVSPKSPSPGFADILREALHARESLLVEKSELLFNQLITTPAFLNSATAEEKEIIYEHTAKNFANTNRLQEAKQVLESALIDLKLSVKLLLIYAHILLELDQAEEAVATLKKCIFLDQSCIAAHYFIAIAYRKLSRPKESVKYFDAVTKLIGSLPPEQYIAGMDTTTIAELKNIIALSENSTGLRI